MSQSQPTYSPRPLSHANENLWSTLAHLGNVLGFLPSLLILLILGPRSARVRQESREALNFVLTAIVGWVALWLVGLAVGGIEHAAPSAVGLLLVLLGLLVGLAGFAVWVLLVVFSIVAAVRVSTGASYRYPLSLRFIK